MRAVLCKEWGGPEKLVVEDIPSPPMRDGAVRVAVHAAGVNFADLLLIAGQYQEKPAFPFIPGAEVAGVVTEVGAGVSGVETGDRVLAIAGSGAFAEEVVVSADRVYRIPDKMEFAAAAGFPVAYGTSHGALAWRAHLKAGEWLLVLGAAGGVGLTAVEIGKVMGAKVIACAGGAEKLGIAQQHGADHLIDYSREDIRERVKAITGGHGADVVTIPSAATLSTPACAPSPGAGASLLLALPRAVSRRSRRTSCWSRTSTLLVSTGVRISRAIRS